MVDNGALSVPNFSKSMKQFVDTKRSKVDYARVPPKPDDTDLLDSVYTIAQSQGLTLQDWVAVNPDYAISVAQCVVSNWEKLLANTSITQQINGFRVRREGAQLLEKSVQAAKDNLIEVYAIANKGSPEQLRKDRLIETLYNKALNGDVKAIAYFMDRVDGKIKEEIPDGLDHDNAMNVFKIVHGLFMKQLEVLNSGPGTKIICCSRKAGKTHLLAAIALIECLRATNTTCIIIGKTMQIQEALINAELNKIIDANDLRTSKGERINWRRLENGSKIVICGLSNTKDPDKIRGFNAPIIIMDEFFHYDSELLEYMQHEVLEPMQLAYANSYKMIMVGTPPRTRGTHGERMWNSLKVPHFTWTAKDNPHIKDFDNFVAEKAKEKGIDITNPYVRREYFAEWVYDEDALLYPKYYVWNEEVLPNFNIDRICIGIDYGTAGNDAIIATAWDTQGRRGFIFFDSKFNRLTCPTNMTQFEFLKQECRQVWELSLDFWPHLEKTEANARITWEADSSDGMITEELQCNLKCRFKELTMNIGTAHKHDKILMQDKIRDLFRTANLLVRESSKTEMELMMTVLKRDTGGNLLLDIDDKHYHPDLLPALRYSLWPVIGTEVLRNRGGTEM